MTTRKKISYTDYLSALNAELKKHPAYRSDMAFYPGPGEKAEAIKTGSPAETDIYNEVREVVEKAVEVKRDENIR
ncbi:hypothetical protein EOM81_11825 [bacterium]|nr:hypothetical protein [bacterium]